MTMCVKKKKWRLTEIYGVHGKNIFWCWRQGTEYIIVLIDLHAGAVRLLAGKSSRLPIGNKWIRKRKLKKMDREWEKMGMVTYLLPPKWFCCLRRVNRRNENRGNKTVNIETPLVVNGCIVDKRRVVRGREREEDGERERGGRERERRMRQREKEREVEGWERERDGRREKEIERER